MDAEIETVDENGNDVEEASPDIAPRKPRWGHKLTKQHRRPPPVATVSETASQQAVEADGDVGTWFTTLAPSSNLKIKLIRLQPETFGGHHMAGAVANFDEPFTEFEIQERFGGGKYQILAHGPRSDGKVGFLGSRIFKISGDPKVTAELHQDNGQRNGHVPSDDIQRRALEMVERAAAADRKRLEDMQQHDRNRSAIDPALLQLLQDASRKPDTSATDTLLSKMIDGESARLESLRMQHGSELNQLRQSNADELRSARDYFKQEMASKDESHRRELATMRETQEARIEAMKQGYEGRLEIQKGRTSDLERLLTETKAELVELRGRKDKSTVDQLTEIAKLRETMEKLGMGGSSSEEDKPMLDRLIEGGAGLLAKLGQAPPQPQPVQQIAIVPRPAKKPRPQMPAPKPLPVFAEDEAAKALAFLEAAVRNGTEPETAASGVRTVLDGTIIAAIKHEGIDEFAERVLKPDSHSPLCTQAGKVFLRAMVKAL